MALDRGRQPLPEPEVAQAPRTNPHIRAPHYTTQECWLGSWKSRECSVSTAGTEQAVCRGQTVTSKGIFVGLMAHYLREECSYKTNRHLLNGGTAGEAPCCQPAWGSSGHPTFQAFLLKWTQVVLVGTLVGPESCFKLPGILSFQMNVAE